MTKAQQLEQQGIEKGLQQGMEQGIQLSERHGIEKDIEKGIEKGKLDVARTMLHRGMNPSTVMALTGLTSAALAQVEC